MSLTRRTIGIAVATGIALILAAGIYLRIRGEGRDSSDSRDTTAADRPEVSASQSFATDVAIPVAGATVVLDTLVLAVEAPGQAAAQRQAGLLAQIAGRVTQILVRENQPVGGGQLLVRLDTTEYALNVEQARAALGRAEAQFRELTLFDDQIADSAVRAERARVARAKSGLDEARVALEKAQLDLARTRITAPFGGRVANLKVVPGHWVRQGDSVLTVVDLDPIKVEAQVLESEIGFLAAGRRARVTFAAFPDEPFIGRIQTINPLVERQTGAARVTVTIPNREGRILPGMYARAALDARRFPDRVLVPRAAVLERDRRAMLFVYEGDERGGLAKWRYVTPGRQNDLVVEILPKTDSTDTVQPGEIVLVDGHYTLIHDARVRLVQDVRAAGGRPN